LADDLPRAPVEQEGYKKLINLPDWHAWHSMWVKSGMRFFLTCFPCRIMAVFSGGPHKKFRLRQGSGPMPAAAGFQTGPTRRGPGCGGDLMEKP
jgi:hypothetical protein